MRLAHLALAGLAALPLMAQDRAPEDEKKQEEQEEIRRLEAWPEIPKDKAKQVKTDIERLRKARTEEMGVQARRALIEVGAAIVPDLLTKYGKEKDKEALGRIEAVLTAVTGPPHTRLLAKRFGDKSQPVRTWALYRVAEFPDPGIRAAAEKAFQKVAKIKEPEKADRAEHLAAALAATSGGSHAALDYLFGRARKGWGKHGVPMRNALEAVRGADATKTVAAHLEGLEGDRQETIAALNLLSGCGDKSAAGTVKLYLESTDNSIRIAAINALRGIVDGDPPIDKLPVFKAIELANEWKTRV